MGALLSIPFLALPSLAGMGGWIASCCGAAACGALFRGCGSCQSSIMTRIAYAALFLLNSLISWIMLSGWAVKKLQHLTLDYMEITCAGSQCYGVLAVHRINFALGILHLLLAIVLFGVKSTRDPRSAIQNGWWGPKLLVWLGLIVLSFFIPNGFFMVWGNYFALSGSVLFILYSLILLIDFAHTWAETCLENFEATESKSWQVILVGSTLAMYAGGITMTVLMYIFFANSGCGLNKAFISINLVLSIISTGVAIHPFIQEYNSRSGLVQSAMVCLYASYLTFSAVCNEPDDRHCNPLARSKGSRTASVVLGALFTFLAIAYSTTRAATRTGGIGNRASGAGYIAVGSETGEHDLVANEPEERARMRRQAVQDAVESGGLPASALDEDNEDENEQDGPTGGKDDEKTAVQYHYTTFHFVFFLATCYTACLLTNWNTMKAEEISSDETLVHIGRSYAVVWVKIVSSWVVYLLYVWSLVLPVMQEYYN